MSQRFVIASILLMTLISMNQMSLSPPVSANSGIVKEIFQLYGGTKL